MARVLSLIASVDCAGWLQAAKDHVEAKVQEKVEEKVEDKVGKLQAQKHP